MGDMGSSREQVSFSWRNVTGIIKYGKLWSNKHIFLQKYTLHIPIRNIHYTFPYELRYSSTLISACLYRHRLHLPEVCLYVMRETFSHVSDASDNFWSGWIGGLLVKTVCSNIIWSMSTLPKTWTHFVTRTRVRTNYRIILNKPICKFQEFCKVMYMFLKYVMFFLVHWLLFAFIDLIWHFQGQPYFSHASLEYLHFPRPVLMFCPPRRSRCYRTTR